MNKIMQLLRKLVNLSAKTLPRILGDPEEHKKVEQAWHESERGYRALLEHSHDAVFVLDMDGRLINANHRAVEMFGYAIKELQKLNIRDLSAEESANDTILARLTEGEYIPIYEGLFRKRDGRLIPAEVSAELVYTLEGGSRHIKCVVHDISDRKQSEQDLQAKIEEEREFQAYLKQLHEVTIELTQIENLDTFYKRIIELGRERLGFDRLGLLLYDEEHAIALGTYGTNRHGEVVAEYHIRLDPAGHSGILQRTIESDTRFWFDEESDLYSNYVTIGTGWSAMSALWNGKQILGWLGADNGVQHKPVSQSLLEILALYSLSVGALLARKRAEADLRESEEKFRSLLAAAPIAIVTTDPIGQIILVNQQAEKLFGYGRSELVGQPVEVLIPEQARDDYIAYRITYTAAQPVQPMSRSLELVARHKDGSQFPAEIRLSHTETKAGIMVMNFLVDITERKRTAAELERQRAFLQQVIDVSPSMIFVKDYAGRFVLANPALAWMHNTTVEALIGKTDADISVSANEAKGFLEADRRVITTGEPLFLEESMTTSAHEVRWLQTTKVPIISADGLSKYVLGVATDVTERRQAEEALRQALAKEKELNELKLRFVSMASHDFRLPLTSIMSASGLLRHYADRIGEERRLTYFNRIETSVRQLLRMLDDMLVVFQMETGNLKFKPEQLNIETFFQGIVEEFQTIYDDTYLIVYESQFNTIALADPRLLRQIATNLISNALKYSPQGSEVRVILEPHNGQMILTVRDQGIGIPEMDQTRLFEAFQRASNVDTIQGTGLGLAIVKQAIDLHGGSVHLQSKVGVGTIVTVSIPISM